MRSFITDPSGTNGAKAKEAQLKNHYGEALPPAAPETLPSFVLPSCFQFTFTLQRKCLSEGERPVILLRGRAEPRQNEVHRGANVMRSAIKPLQTHLNLINQRLDPRPNVLTLFTMLHEC